MIAVIDVSGNNLTSLANALTRLGCSYTMTHNPALIQQASHVILPGVGTAAAGMHALKEYQLIEVIRKLTQPLLGICLGMQLLLESSDEGGAALSCLGLIPGRATHLTQLRDYPLPHMGWNQLQWQRHSYLSAGLSAQDYLYFVHSYALLEQEHALASCQYSDYFCAIVQRDNVLGMQFHPEKSAAVGARLLSNWFRGSVLCK